MLRHLVVTHEAHKVFYETLFDSIFFEGRIKFTKKATHGSTGQTYYVAGDKLTSKEGAQVLKTLQKETQASEAVFHIISLKMGVEIYQSIKGVEFLSGALLLTENLTQTLESLKLTLEQEVL